MASKRLGFLSQVAEDIAPRLLGCIIERDIGNQTLRGKIVETEAYQQSDAASHSFNGKTPRTSVMFGPAGHLYVYFTYGMHYCCNVVVGEEGYGAAVLIRAVEPLDGINVMEHNRAKVGIEMTNGPAKFAQAFSIKLEHNGADLKKGSIRLIEQPALDLVDVVQTTRIGISKAKDVPWRFYIRNNKWVSKL